MTEHELVQRAFEALVAERDEAVRLQALEKSAADSMARKVNQTRAERDAQREIVAKLIEGGIEQAALLTAAEARLAQIRALCEEQDDKGSRLFESCCTRCSCPLPAKEKPMTDDQRAVSPERHPYQRARIIFDSNIQADICGVIDPATGAVCAKGDGHHLHAAPPAADHVGIFVE